MRGVLIREDGSTEEVQPNGYDDLRELVDGRYIESLGVGRDDAVAYGDEEAKLVNEPVENELATRLVYGNKDDARRRGELAQQEYRNAGFEIINHDTGDSREPFIAGNVVVVGFDHRTGDDRDIPDDLATLLLASTPTGAGQG